MRRVTAVAVLVFAAGTAIQAAPAAADDDPGNVLIADQFNNRVVEVNSEHQIVWSFGNGSHVAGPNSIVAPNDVERVGDLTLIAGTGAPPAPSPTEPPCAMNGCPDNRVIFVNHDGHIVWQYGKAGVTGSGPNQLNTPVFAAALPGRHVLVTDQGNSRVIEINRQHQIVWQYGTTGMPGIGPEQLNNPNSSELLANGHILIADENNNRVIEVTRAGQIVWQYGDPNNTSIINGAAFASRLPNGDTLITDAGNSRALEVNQAKQVVWSYVTNTRPGSISAPLPTRAVRLENGDTLISDQFNHQVIEVTREGKIVFTQGKIGVAGNGFDQLNAPYDAKVIGDYTGLTPPFGFGDGDGDGGD
jgi:outer membrane protein assembly factor BamB